MWNISLEDIHRAKGQLQARRAKIEAKYMEETRTLDADLADIETLERVAGAFAQKHPARDDLEDGAPQEVEAQADMPCVEEAQPVVEPSPEPEPMAAVDASVGPQTKGVSRWRLHLDSRATSEAE
jgi:hypothetical protein